MNWSGRTIVLVPGECVLFTSAAVPSRQQRKIMQALPYMVEEQLAQDVEETHFAIGDRTGRGQISVAVVAREQMQSWLESLREAGISAQVMVTDSLCVPMQSEHRNILIDADRALIRSDKNLAMAADRELVGTLLSLEEDVEEGEESEQAISVLIEPEAEESISLQVTQWEAELNCPVSKELLDYSTFETLCRNYDSSAINLLQAEFAALESKSTSSTSWKSVAWVAVGFFVLHILLLAGKGAYLSFEADRLKEDALALYVDVFPNDKNIRDIRRRWQSHLKGNSGPTQQSDVLTVFGEAAKNMDGSRLQLDNVNFNEQRGDLILQIRGASSDRLVEYVQRLVKLGMAAEVGTINQEEDSVQGSVRIRQVGRK
jgi:general secretion pathway protein L